MHRLEQALGAGNIPLTAEDIIGADRLRFHAYLQQAAAAMRAEMRPRLEEAVRGSGGGEGLRSAVPTVPQALEADLREARLAGRLEGMKEALGLLGSGGDHAAAPSARPIMPGRPSRPHLGPDAGAAQAPAAGDPPWTSLQEKFFAARPSVGARARESHEHAFEEFKDIVGDKAVCAITKADVVRYVEWLEARPNGRNGRGRLSRDTVVKKLQHVRAFLAWAAERDYAPSNVAAGVKPRTATAAERDGDEDRRALTVDELRLLFRSPLFTGCHHRRQRSRPGPLILRDEPYWFLIVALLAGPRVEELAQAPSALVDLDGVPCLDLRQSGTKTFAAPRLVPIIPDLRALGFVEWAAHKATGSGRLFDGEGASNDWSKWTNRYLDDIGLDDPTIVTHSLRHCFRQMLRAARIGDELADKVFGHSLGNPKKTGGRYGRDLSPQEARAIAESVRSPIALEHLGTWRSGS